MRNHLLFTLFVAAGLCLPLGDAAAVSIDARDVPVRTVVEGLARSGALNLIVDDTVQGSLTLRLQDVTIEEALQAIADSQDLIYDKTGPIRVMTAGHKTGANRQLRNFHLGYAAPDEAVQALQALLPSSALQFHSTTNSLVASATSREAAQIESLLAQIDVPPRQVKVAVEVAAVNRDAMKELGVDWQWTPWQGGPGRAYSVTCEGQLHALETKGKARLLARPHLIAMNGKEARILIGDRVPVLTEKNQNGQTSTTTEYTDAGIKLAYTPRVHEDGSLTAHIQAEVSTPILVPEMKAYRIMTRQAQTDVRLDSGQTLAIGGLIDREDLEHFRKVPILGDLPLIGRLFQSRYKMNKETEVIILVKAEIL